jgi:nucleoside-triphosphatase THEP1
MSKNPVLGSLPLRGGSFIENIRKRKDILLVRVSEKNRDELVNEFLRDRDQFSEWEPADIALEAP